MTTGTDTPAALVPAPALTQAEVEVVLPCPLCGTPRGERCEHPLSRLRAALRWRCE